MSDARGGGMGIRGFLGHSNRAGGRSKLLKDWTEKPDHAVTVWLHTGASILALWRHGWAKLVVREDRESKKVTREIWTDRLVCYEDEDVLRAQHWRDRVTGEREHPPLLCPHCKMIEWVRAEVRAGRLSWTAPLFRFEGDDPRQTRVLHAGGLYNAFGDKKLTDAQKREMAAVPQKDGGPLYAKDAWKQNQAAKLEYCFTVVDHDDLAAGAQVTIESNLLGDKVKETIAKAMKSLGEERGDPTQHPYAIRWEYDPTPGIEFNKMYDALRMERVALTPAIEKLIRGTDPPDVSQYAQRFNLATHRANLERHALSKRLPLDEFFADALEWERRQKQAPAAAEQPPPRARSPEVGGDAAPGNGAPQQAADEEEMVACDDCEKPMRAKDEACPHCGKRYEVDAAPPPPAPKLPKRSEVRAQLAQQRASAPAAPVRNPGSATSPMEPAAEEDPDDLIPF